MINSVTSKWDKYEETVENQANEAFLKNPYEAGRPFLDQKC